ncbi:MAG: FecR family protein [Bacteroidota bacterium]
MDQGKLQNYIQYFLKGKLSLQHEKELLSWIRQSEENKAMFLQVQQRISREMAIRTDKSVNIRWQQLKQKIEKQEGTGRRQFIYRVAAVAAAFIAGVVLTVLFSEVSEPLTDQSAQLQNITVPYGARTSTTLPDGSKVWLNAGTTLSFPAGYGKTRPVTLNGEAFFEVVKNSRPFIVKTVYGEVEVKGTSFNVKAYKNENLQATLVEGAVVLHDNAAKKEVPLRPGQHAELQNQTITVENVDTELYTSWTDGKIIFRKAHMPEVARRLERWYNVKIVLADDPRLKEIWYSGTLEMESFSEVLELLKVTAPIDYSYNEKERKITIRYRQN